MKKDMVRANGCIRRCQDLVKETSGLSSAWNGLDDRTSIALRVIAGDCDYEDCQNC